jgi:hypothetical protein
MLHKPTPRNRVVTQLAAPTWMVTLSPLGPITPWIGVTATTKITPFSPPYAANDDDSHTVVVVETPLALGVHWAKRVPPPTGIA